MYERDWNKNITAVYAFENGHLANVTDTYTTHQHRDRTGDRTGHY
jgi:hypothetical protein